MPERRIRRSSHRGQALGLQLEACVERSGLRAMVMSDAQGLLIAASPWTRSRSDDVAALLPHVASDGRFVGALRRGRTSEKAVHVRSFRSGRRSFFLCTVGGPDGDAGRQMDVALSGARRILGSDRQTE